MSFLHFHETDTVQYLFLTSILSLSRLFSLISVHPSIHPFCPHSFSFTFSTDHGSNLHIYIYFILSYPTFNFSFFLFPTHSLFGHFFPSIICEIMFACLTFFSFSIQPSSLQSHFHPSIIFPSCSFFSPPLLSFFLPCDESRFLPSHLSLGSAAGRCWSWAVERDSRVSWCVTPASPKNTFSLTAIEVCSRDFRITSSTTV